jgi:hypothetical protein
MELSWTTPFVRDQTRDCGNWFKAVYPLKVVQWKCHLQKKKRYEAAIITPSIETVRHIWSQRVSELATFFATTKELEARNLTRTWNTYSVHRADALGYLKRNFRIHLRSNAELVQTNTWNLGFHVNKGFYDQLHHCVWCSCLNKANILHSKAQRPTAGSSPTLAVSSGN